MCVSATVARRVQTLHHVANGLLGVGLLGNLLVWSLDVGPLARPVFGLSMLCCGFQLGVQVTKLVIEQGRD